MTFFGNRVRAANDTTRAQINNIPLKSHVIPLLSSGTTYKGGRRGGLMVSVLDSRSSGRVWVLAGDIVLCSWARHFNLTVALFTQVYKFMGTGEFNAGGNPAMDWHPIQGGVEILLVASCYKKPEISAGLMGLQGS